MSSHNQGWWVLCLVALSAPVFPQESSQYVRAESMADQGRVLDVLEASSDERRLVCRLRLVLEEEPMLDPDTHAPVLDAYGKPKTDRHPVILLEQSVGTDGDARRYVEISKRNAQTVHLLAEQQATQFGSLAWSAEAKRFFVVLALSVEERAYVEVYHFGTTRSAENSVLEQQDWPAKRVASLVTRTAQGGPENLVRRLEVKVVQPGLELNLHRELQKGAPSRLVFDEVERTWSGPISEVLESR